MINIKIKTVKPGSLPHKRVGDWHWEGDKLSILVEDRRDEKHEWLVGVHEIVEAFLCRVNGITEEEIDKFDIEHNDEWVPSGPGYKEHLVSTGIESILAAITGVNWDQYEAEIAESATEPQPLNEQNNQKTESGRGDLNSGPPAPKADHPEK